jgi:predicted nucleotidyltransferase
MNYTTLNYQTSLLKKGKIQGLDFFGFINSLEDALGVHVDVLTYQSLDDDVFIKML